MGSGLAGLLLANLLQERGAAVTLISKETFSDSNTFYAQGGLAAVTADNIIDSPAEHLKDTIKSGAGLADEVVAKNLILGAPNLVQELSRFGMSFDTKPNGNFELAREGGHSKARVLHSKDTTGKAISNSLLSAAQEKAKSDPNFRMLEYCFAFNLLTERNRVVGAEVLHNGAVTRIMAKHVVLATGGAGQIFSRTTNPLIATADGVALAYRAGATLADLEFMQFHPTALAKPGAPAFLISEAVRGAGAILKDEHGEPFMHKFHADADLATRDVVARGIHATMLRSGSQSVSLDLRPIGNVAVLERFPNIVDTARKFGIDPLTEAIPVCPAAHYFMGGVLTDEVGRTTLPGLYAIGEVANTGLHGANRLASNSLLEAGVMALNLADALTDTRENAVNAVTLFDYATTQANEMPIKRDEKHSNKFDLKIPQSTTTFQSAMFEFASLTRSQAGLLKLQELNASNISHKAILNVANISAANMLLVGELMTTAALNRTESRGSHFREDFPALDDSQFARRYAVRNGNWFYLSRPNLAMQIDKKSAPALRFD